LSRAKFAPGVARDTKIQSMRWTADEVAAIKHAMYALRQKGEIPERFSDLVRWPFVNAGVLGPSSLPKKPGT
jgi:hypothetical protein